MTRLILLASLTLNAVAEDLPTGAMADRQLVKLLDVKTVFVDSLGGK